MVFFTCNLCGDSVKKPSVEKHFNTKCRGAEKNVSCMDCQKDFRGQEYVAHTKCISEIEKYSGKNYVPKEQKNTNAKKQEGWMDIVRSILESSEYKLKPQVRATFQKLQSVDNVPRKKAKFQNFATSCMRISKPIAAEVWDVLEKEIEKMKQSRQQAATNGSQKQGKQEQPEESAMLVETKQALQNGVKRVATDENGHTKPAKKKKVKAAEEEAEKTPTDTQTHNANETSTVAETDEVFDWTATLEKLVSKHAEGILVEKLKKKLQKKYAKKLGLEELTEKQQKKFEKKFTKNLKKSPAIQVEGELVKSS